MSKGWLRIVPTEDKTVFRVEHNCNGKIQWAAHDEVDEKTARLLELAILEGKRRKQQEIINALTGEQP